MFGPQGHATTDYPFVPPHDVPDGVIDFEVRAFDDLGIATTSSPVRVTKGTPCVDASTCLEGQKCDAGKCFWDPPTAEHGAACPYPQFCISGTCLDGTCQQTCDPESSRPQCPDSYTCDEASNTCSTQVGGGCCSVAAPYAGWFHGGLGVTVVAFVFRRRRTSERRKIT
jgi:hypothetical protein